MLGPEPAQLGDQADVPRFGFREHVVGRSEIFDGDPQRLENRALRGGLPSRYPPQQHLAQFSRDVAVPDRPLGQGNQVVAGFVDRRFPAIYHQPRPRHRRTVELPGLRKAGADRVDVDAGLEPARLDHRGGRCGRGTDQVSAPHRLLGRSRGFHRGPEPGPGPLSERGEPTGIAAPGPHPPERADHGQRLEVGAGLHPLPMIARSEASGRDSARVATPRTAAVRMAVMLLASMTAIGAPVSGENRRTRPWWESSRVPSFSGNTPMALRPRAGGFDRCAGMTPKIPRPGGTRKTVRSGRVASPRDRVISAASISSTHSAMGRSSMTCAWLRIRTPQIYAELSYGARQGILQRVTGR